MQLSEKIIEFDTFLVGSRFIDIGDFFRAINFSDNQTVLTYSSKKIADAMRGYMSLDQRVEKEFVEKALAATCQITLELCSRFIVDYFEDGYFGWDPKKYKSRKENNKARAIAQWRLYEKMKEDAELKSKIFHIINNC